MNAGVARRSLCLAPPLALMVGCAAPLATPIGRGDALGLEFTSEPVDAASAISNLSIARKGAQGMAAGAMAGGLSGFYCGPWFFVCIPAGMLVGGVVGYGGGAAVGAAGALEAHEQKALRERLSTVLRSHDVQAELREQITLRAGKVWRLSDQAPDEVLGIHLRSAALTSTRDESVGLIVKVHTVLSRAGDSPRKVLGERDFALAPAASPVAVWLDERSDFIDTLFSTCVQQLASQIVAEYSRA